jgi:23S rRNA (guanosine2251-2'-O)-methyltransferase
MEGIVRTSSGAALALPVVHFPNELDLVNELKQVGFKLVGADINGSDLKEFGSVESGKLALFLGSEGRGLSGKIVKKLDHKVSIKMSNNFDSLNVSVAAGIMIYELGNRLK